MPSTTYQPLAFDNRKLLVVSLYCYSSGQEILMARTAEKVMHPYIVSRKDYCGGSPVIKGTKFPVRSVVTYVLQQGLSPEELVKEFSYLTLAQIYDALSYYYDHKEDIERELRESTEERLRPKRSR